MDRHAPPAGFDTSPGWPGCGYHECTRICSGIPSSPPCSTPALISEMCRSPPGTPIGAPPCATTGRKNLDRHPNYIPAAYMASGT